MRGGDSDGGHFLEVDDDEAAVTDTEDTMASGGNPDGGILLRDAILSIAGERSESKKDTTEGRIVGIIKDLSAEKDLETLQDWTLRTNDILQQFNEDRPADKHVTSQWMGKKLKSLSLRHRTVNGRSEIMLTSYEYWTLVSQYGCGGSGTSESKSHPQTLPENTMSYQHVTDVVGSSRECLEPWDEGYEPPLLSEDEVIYYDGYDEDERREHEEG
jgi:hypothetical protein